MMLIMDGEVLSSCFKMFATRMYKEDKVMMLQQPVSYSVTVFMRLLHDEY